MSHQTIDELLEHFKGCRRCQKEPGVFCKVGSEKLLAVESAKLLVTEKWLLSLGLITEGQRRLLNHWCEGADWLGKSIPVQAANFLERMKKVNDEKKSTLE